MNKNFRSTVLYTTDKIYYLDRLNVCTLLGTPIMDNRNTDFYGHWGLHGYWIINHYKIDEHLGTQKDFVNFNQRRKDKDKRLL